jgi:uncharacterized membrane protein YphA (DoxX/SURF4 family)
MVDLSAAAPVSTSTRDRLTDDPAYQAFWILRIGFAVAPILFGLDKFLGFMIDDWTKYLASEFDSLIPGTAQDAMHIVGVVEIVAGILVAVRPRIGGYVVAVWLSCIVANLAIQLTFWDIALRDFGLALGALALARLATAYERSGREASDARV